MSDLAADWDAIKAPPKQAKSLADEWDSIQPKKAEVTPAPPAKNAPGALESVGAGIGSAFGKGVLAVQQIAGKGLSLAGDAVGVDAVKSAGDWLAEDAKQGAIKLTAENAPYEDANFKSNVAGQVAGVVLNPINKVIPVGAAPATVLGSVAKGAAQGAALNTLTSPVTNDGNFLIEKGKQAIVGGIGGGLAGGVLHAVSQGINRTIQGFKSVAGRVGNPSESAETVVAKSLSDNGIDAAVLRQERPGLFEGLKTQVQDAITSGKKVDTKALERLTQAQTLPVPVPMLRGQITRDPMHYAAEQNLRGIQGIGEPIKETITAQNRALIANLDEIGAAKGGDIISGGKLAIDTLKAADKAAQDGVKGAYSAFKNATGKELDVPLAGLAQDYAKTSKEFGEAIPAVIRGKFEALGLMSGKARQTLTISDAEGLIKSINRNYDPKNIVQARALDELRQGVQRAISDGAGASAEGTAAAALAKAARSAAKDRFNVIDSTPGLKAALRGDEPDKFIQRFVLQGNVAEIKNMMGVLEKASPEAAEGLRNSLVNFIKGRVTGLNNEGTFSQAQLKGFVKDPNMSARLSQVLGPEKMAQLKQLNAVAENALFAPTGAAVNRSNTASAGANIVKAEIEGGGMNTLLEISKRIPGVSDAALQGQKATQSARASRMVDEAVSPSVGIQSGERLVREILAKNIRPDVLGQRAGAALLETNRNKRR
jgi:hypothetical protein